MRYVPYTYMTDRIANSVRKETGVSKKEARGMDFANKAIRLSYEISPPSFLDSMDTQILIDESSHIHSKRLTVFPEGTRLLDALRRSKLHIDPQDFKLPAETVMVAFPSGYQINGRQAPGCLVSMRGIDAFKRRVQTFSEECLPVGTPKIGSSFLHNPGRRIFHVIYCMPDESSYCGIAYYMFSAPPEWLEALLVSSPNVDEFKAKLQNGIDEECAGDGLKWALEMEKEENEFQFHLVRLLVTLFVYLEAFPKCLKDGLPDGIKAPKGRYTPCSQGMTLPEPEAVKPPEGGTHASPCEHLRAAHFRSYPRRKDGTRSSKELIPIAATWVNARIDAKTAVRLG